MISKTISVKYKIKNVTFKFHFNIPQSNVVLPYHASINIFLKILEVLFYFPGQILRLIIVRVNYQIPQNEYVEDDQRRDGEHNVQNCVEPQIVNVYVPVIRSAKEFYYKDIDNVKCVDYFVDVTCFKWKLI